MERQHTRRVALLITLAATLGAAGVTGCKSNNDDEPQGDIADAYALVIRWFVDNAAANDVDPDDNQIVFIEAHGEGVGIGLETQASLVAATDDFADVRFIDDRSEAMDDDVVREGVILLALGPAVADDNLASITCDQILGEGATLSWTFDMAFADDEWTLTSVPTPLSS